jgi:hypothetical protein
MDNILHESYSDELDCFMIMISFVKVLISDFGWQRFSQRKETNDAPLGLCAHASAETRAQ